MAWDTPEDLDALVAEWLRKVWTRHLLPKHSSASSSSTEWPLFVSMGCALPVGLKATCCLMPRAVPYQVATVELEVLLEGKLTCDVLMWPQTAEVKELIELIGLGDKASPYTNMIKSMWNFDSFSRDTRRMYENAQARLDILVHDVMDLCIRVLRLQGPQIEQLMNADYKM